MMICRAILIGLLGLGLGGCSVVVFEDGPACPADRACPVAAVTAPAIAPTAPAPATKAATASTSAQSAPSGQSATPSVKTDISIDGYHSYFDYDSAALSTRTRTGLLFVADYLKANPAVRILIEGHCDERGTRDYNIALGHKRADAVRMQLARMGVDKRRITTKSYGKERPAVFGASAETWAKNRRTIIRLRGE